MTDQLGLYNGALLLCGERNLGTLLENRPPRFYLDQAWDDGNAIRACLEQGYWNFATRFVRADFSPSVEPDFGMRRVFDKPDDYVRTAGVWCDENQEVPLTQYRDEANFWFADIDTLYISYISSLPDYGYNLAIWPETFKRFVEAYLAQRIVKKLTQNASRRKEVEDEYEKLRLDARSKDAQNQPSVQMPRGSWSRARQGSYAPYNGSGPWNGSY